MILKVLAIGTPRGCVAEAIQEYEERARRYWRLETVELKGGAGRGANDRRLEILEAEAARILPRLPEAGQVVALTRVGRAIDSRGLAELLQEWAVRSVPEGVFVLGGAFGLGEPVLRRASAKLSLSSMTLPHELARLVLAEQLYRAGTILKNEPYHKGP